jgi:hypothetical protein
MTSYTYPTFTAYMSQSTVEVLRSDPRVEKVLEVYRAADFSTWNDRVDGGESVSWGKIAIGTDDTNQGASTRIYLIDGGAQAHVDLGSMVHSTYTPANNPGSNPIHATHIAGIIAAGLNNSWVRGVTPGATLVSVDSGLDDDEIKGALDWTLADMENRGIYGVVNISRNSTRWAAGAGNQLDRYVRRVSNRAFVAQSAGNNRELACNVAYGPANTQDGIMVVGGIAHDGETGSRDLNGVWHPYQFDNRIAYGPDHALEPGSNFGLCVEVWAPSQYINSTWSPTGTIQFLSGTSMAAPHIAALAARYGTSQTMPLEREHYIRSKLVATGRLDENNATIVVPSFTQSPSYTIPTKLTPNYGFGNATDPGSIDSCVYNNVYLNCYWGSGGTNGWFTLVLGSQRTISALRVVPSSWPATGATASHYIYVDNQTTPTTLVAQFHSSRMNLLEPTVLSIPNAVGSSVRIESYVNGSWLAWREIEVYGN